MDHQLREQRVVLRWQVGLGFDPGIDPDSRAIREPPGSDASRDRTESACRVLGVQPHFDRMSPRECLEHVSGKALPGRHPDLPRDEVETGDELRDPMLDLEPRVHLEEVVVAVGVHEELDGRGIMELDRAGHPAGTFEQRGARLVPDAGRWRLLHELLVTSLDRAISLAQDGQPDVGTQLRGKLNEIADGERTALSEKIRETQVFSAEASVTVLVSVPAARGRARVPVMVMMPPSCTPRSGADQL